MAASAPGKGAKSAALAVAFLALAVAAGSAAAAPEALRLKHHVIEDREGYGREIGAISLLLPVDWTVESRIAWNKPCSGNDLFEVMLRAQSADGRFGFQILPSYRVEHFEAVLLPGSMPPAMIADTQAQQDRLHQQVIEQYRGTNCQFSEPMAALEVVRRFVLPQRPPGARIASSKPAEQIRDSLREMLQRTLQPIPNTQITPIADAVVARLAYETGGEAFEEDVVVGIVGTAFRSEWPSLGRIDVNSSAYTLPIHSAWAPAGRLDDMAPVISAVQSSMRDNPRWAAAVSRTRAEIDRIRREGLAARAQIWSQSSQEISDIQMQSWQTAQQASDEAHENFTDYIADVQPVVDPATGHEVDMPAHYDNYYTNGEGEYVAVSNTVDVHDLYPGQNWQEMEPVR